MVRRFLIRHFCGWFLYGKMAAWLNGKTEGLFSFWVDVLGFWQQEGWVEKRF